MPRVRCNYCDARADRAEHLNHAPGCPVKRSHSKTFLECKSCGRAGEHAPRCPMVKGNAP